MATDCWDHIGNLWSGTIGPSACHMGKNAQTSYTYQIYEKAATLRIYQVCGAHSGGHGFIRGSRPRWVRKEIYRSYDTGRVYELDKHLDHNLARSYAFLRIVNPSKTTWNVDHEIRESLVIEYRCCSSGEGLATRPKVATQIQHNHVHGYECGHSWLFNLLGLPDL